MRDRVVIATNFGFNIVGGQQSGLSSRPNSIKRVAEASFDRLGVEVIDRFCQRRVDPHVPVEDVAGAVKGLIAAGKVRHSVSRRQARRPIAEHMPCSR